MELNGTNVVKLKASKNTLKNVFFAVTQLLKIDEPGCEKFHVGIIFFLHPLTVSLRRKGNISNLDKRACGSVR